MSNWIAGLSPDDRMRWDEFVDHFRRDAVTKMAASAFVVSLVPGEFDVKFATELGAAIMLNKPIVAIALPGATIPGKLMHVADHVVFADIDTEAGQRELAELLAELSKGEEADAKSDG